MDNTQVMDKCMVVIMGAPLCTGNRGVSALGASLVKLVEEARPGSQSVMLIGNQNGHPFQVAVNGANRTVPVVNFRVSPRSALRDHLFWIAFLALIYRFLPSQRARQLILKHSPWIKTIKEAVLVGDIRGGDSFSDIYGLERFLLSSLPILTVIWVRRGIVLFPQTYGPYKHWIARFVAGHILRHATSILSRDLESIVTVRQLVGQGKSVCFCPDVAFALEATRPQSVQIEPALPAPGVVCLVGLNVNGLMYNGGYTRNNMFGLKLDYRAFLKQLVTALLKDEKVHILLVPHTFAPVDNVESDPQACREVQRGLPESTRGRVHLVSGEYDQHEIKGIIGNCDFFIGSRMHSCIAALSQGIPTIGVAYSKKFKGVFDSVGGADWVIDGREVVAESAVTSILSRFENRLAMRKPLAEKVAQAQALLGQTFAKLLVPASPQDKGPVGRPGDRDSAE